MIKDRECVSPFVGLGQPLRSQAEMDLLGLFGARGDVGLRPRRGLHDGIGGAFPSGKMAGDKRCDLIVLQVACRGDHDVIGPVEAPDVRDEVVAGQAVHRQERPDDGAPQRVAVPYSLGEEVLHQFIRGVFVTLDLLGDDLALAFDGFFGQRGVQQHVGVDLQRPVQVGRQHLHVKYCLLSVGEGVHLPADVVRGLGDFQRRTRRRPFEEEVFEEVGDAVLFDRFVARADAHPDAHGHSTHVGNPLREHADSAGEHAPGDGAAGWWQLRLAHNCLLHYLPWKRIPARGKMANTANRANMANARSPVLSLVHPDRRVRSVR